MTGHGEVHDNQAWEIRVAGIVPSPPPQLLAMAYLMGLSGMNPGTCSRLASGAAARLHRKPVGWLVRSGLPPRVARATVRLLRGEPADGDLPGARNDTGQVPQ